MFDQQATQDLLDELAKSLDQWLTKKSLAGFEIIGIRSGGVWVAQALMERLNINQALGELDISFYRDDFNRKGLNDSISPTSLPFNTESKHLILVDDVLMSGRSVRAAMNELFDFGRPASSTLVTLIDLGRRELPIAPQITGAMVTLDDNERVKLIGPDNLEVSLYS
jgi:pyrimidine operon attenuation protein/uracil phosphoribosyltransferase